MSLGEGHKCRQVQSAELLLTQRICNIRTYTASALNKDVGNLIKNVFFQHFKDILYFVILYVFPTTFVWNERRESIFLSFPGTAFLHLGDNFYVPAHKSQKLPCSLAKYSKGKFGLFDILKKLLVFDKHFVIRNAYFFLKRENGMTKQYPFMYRRICFPLVVYYKLALDQIRIYQQQHMIVGNQVFGRKSNST